MLAIYLELRRNIHGKLLLIRTKIMNRSLYLLKLFKKKSLESNLCVLLNSYMFPPRTCQLIKGENVNDLMWFCGWLVIKYPIMNFIWKCQHWLQLCWYETWVFDIFSVEKKAMSKVFNYAIGINLLHVNYIIYKWTIFQLRTCLYN